MRAVPRPLAPNDKNFAGPISSGRARAEKSWARFRPPPADCLLTRVNNWNSDLKKLAAGNRVRAGRFWVQNGVPFGGTKRAIFGVN
jgi:hypothetical protein